MMDFYYPWIDPRVKLVQTWQLEAYLRCQRWLDEGSVRSCFRRFRHPVKKDAVFVPTAEETDDLPLRVLEAVTQIAKAENRYAGDVLNDLLAQPAADVGAKTSMPANAETGGAMAPVANR